MKRAHHVIARAKPVAICLFIATALGALFYALEQYTQYRQDYRIVQTFATTY